jgi:pyruvate dehydrogenase E2 component (dihydrolipoamide acetyltransferase)
MFEFKFPDVGEGITEGKLIKWLVHENDVVKREQSVANVETDKAVVEIPSPVSGKIMKLLYSENDTVYVGKPLMLIDDGQTTFSAPEQKVSLKPQAQPMPSAVKNYETRDQAPANPKVQMSFQPESRLLKEIKVLPSARKFAKEKNIDLSLVKGSGPDGVIKLSDVELFGGVLPAQSMEQNQRIIQQIQQQYDASEILASPSTRQFARDLGVNISTVKGTGSHGIITREDVQNAKNPLASPSITSQSQIIQPTVRQPAATSSPQFSSAEEYIPITTLRQAISRKMSESWNNTVPVTVSDEADVTELVDIRDKNREKYEKQGIKLTYLPFFVKAAILSLQKNPKLNSVVDAPNNRIVQKHYYNIGIAVDTEQGLMVPVIKNAETKSILQIAMEINDLATRARSRTIRIDEMSGGTFTITSIGGLAAGQVFTQIINYPEEAILGIGRIVDKPVFRNGGIFVRKMMAISVTVDHRMIDGADASRFLKTLMEYLENPQTIMMELI